MFVILLIQKSLNLQQNTQTCAIIMKFSHFGYFANYHLSLIFLLTFTI